MSSIIAAPVFPAWIRINMSRHEAMFQSTGVFQPDLEHFEVSPVAGIVPMFQKFTSSVYGDCSTMALRGHDVGPIVPHFYRNAPPDNGLLPLTILSSFCRWPVVAQRRQHGDRALCAYFPGIAPYLYCTSEQEESKEEANPPYEKSKSQKLAEKGLRKFSGAGIGIVMIPTGPFTVTLRLSWTDILLGMLAIVQEKAMAWVFDKSWKALRGARPEGHWFASRFSKTASWRIAREKLVNDSSKDVAFGFGGSFELSAPFQLAKIDYDTGKVSVWTYESEGWKVDPALSGKPLELLPETPSETQTAPAYWADPASGTEPQAALLEDLLEGAPHAF